MLYDYDILRTLFAATGLHWAVIYPDGEPEQAYWKCLPQHERENFSFEKDETGYVTLSRTEVVDEQGVIHEKP